jgi:FMN phosphatase YigB (HAD superfamily)
MKKVIFFDGDGTVWYPSATLRSRKPWWIYEDTSLADPIRELIVTPTTVDLLHELGRRGIKRVLLSTSPLAQDEAILHRIKIAQHVDIHHLLDDVQAAPDYPAGKGDMIRLLLAQYGLTAEDALMVGDSVERDYDAAQAVGVDALMISSDYEAEAIASVPVGRVIQVTADVLKYLD